MTAELVHEIATEALVDAIVTTGRRLGGSVLRGRRSAEESAIVRWFDTYRLVESFPDRPDVVRSAMARTQRQQVLDGDQLRLWAVVDEAALRRSAGDTAVLKNQMEHLRQAARRPNVTLQVLP